MKPRSEHRALKLLRPRLLEGLVMLLLILELAQGVRTIITNQGPESKEIIIQETPGVSHDEYVMLAVSLVVVIEIITNFKYLRRLPCKRLLLASFGALCFSALFTVIEGFLLARFFNSCEHLSLMLSSILLAVWCAKVFRSRKPESL